MRRDTFNRYRQQIDLAPEPLGASDWHLSRSTKMTWFHCELYEEHLGRVEADADKPEQSFQGTAARREVIVLCVRWYLRYPLSYELVAESLGERGVDVDASCIWRWVQAYAPELNKRCRPHLKQVNKSYRIDETYIKVKGEDKYLYRVIDSTGQTIDFCSPPNAFCARPLKHRAMRCHG